MQPKKELASNFIKSVESYRSRAYRDPLNSSIISIAYGLARIYPDGKPIKIADKCTKEDAEKYLKIYLDQNVFPKIDELQEKYHFNDYVYASLSSLSYNTPGKIGPKILDALKNNNLDELANAFLLYNKYLDYKTNEYKVSSGLNNRRLAEIKLFKENS